MTLAFTGAHESEASRLRRRVASLEHQRSELEARVAQAEAAGTGALIAQVHERMDSLEDAVHLMRYGVEDWQGRTDEEIVRGCRELVKGNVARSDEVLVIAKGDPLLLDLYGRRTGNFPQGDEGTYPGFAPETCGSAIAHLEALRRRGSRFLLLPETSAWWLDRFPRFSEHLTGLYEVVAERPAAGLLVDLRTRRELRSGWSSALSEVLERLSGACGHSPAVLDWTTLGVARRLPGDNVFLPPVGDRLPYLDDSVDVVAVENESQLAEARRVALLAVVSLAGTGSQPRVETIEVLSGADCSSMDPHVVVVVPSADPDPTWLAHLQEAIRAEAQPELLLAPEPAVLAAAAAGADLVALVDEGVLPLPGCITAGVQTLQRDQASAVAAKLFAWDGSLEAAGTMVFSDGTSLGVAAGSFEADAPWHEFVRETCTGRGLTMFSAVAVEAIGPRALETLDTVDWCGRLWAGGLRVVYQPEATAVRAEGQGGRVSLIESVEEAWRPLLKSRPDRPSPSDDGGWRSLVRTNLVLGGSS